MDVLMICGLLVLFFQESFAINCHDCTSWSPYCREGVDLPFPAAVATSECKKTDTCYLKKEENGVITRGCADWWMSSQVDINYVGCQTQEVPWMGKQTWCFCQEDYCNGGTIQEIENGIGHREPELRDELGARAAAAVSTSEPTTTSDPWDQDWENIDWNQWMWNEKTGAWESSELNDLSQVNDAADVADVAATTTKQNEYNDFDKDYEVEVKAQSQDPAWNHWYWHADSDRPQWPTNEVREQTTEAAIVAEKIETTTQAIQKPASASQSTPEAEWSEGWEQLLPWWEGNFHQSTTMPPVGIQDINVIDKVQLHDQDGDDLSQVIDVMPDVDWVDSPQVIDNNVEISEADFFCWDCYSDSPLCGERVDSTKAHYLGKTACPATNKCFVRHDGDKTYRGCADGWIGSAVSHDYVGCEVQKLWGKEVEWCFCTASLCNGDSMMDIQEKYLHSEPEVFKGDVMNSSSTQVYDKTGSQFVNTARTTRSIRNETVNTTSSNIDSTATTTSRTVVTDRTTTARNKANTATDKTTVVTADKTSGTSEATSTGKTDAVTFTQQAKDENKESTTQRTSKTEQPTSSQSTTTVKIEAYMSQLNTTTVDSNSTSTEGTQPTDTKTTFNSTSPTANPSNETAITQNVNDNSTNTMNTTSITNSTTTENSTKTDMTDSKSTTTETVTGDADTKTSTSGYTKTSPAESKTTTSKAAIRKRESGMQERVVEAKNSKLYEALIGK